MANKSLRQHQSSIYQLVISSLPPKGKLLKAHGFLFLVLIWRNRQSALALEAKTARMGIAGVCQRNQTPDSGCPRRPRKLRIQLKPLGMHEEALSLGISPSFSF
jgi:hypothetical protein